MKEKKTYVTRTGVSFEPELLSKLDEWIKEKKFPNRSEAIRFIVREHLAKSELNVDPNVQVVGSLTYLYDHHSFNSSEKLTQIQHDNDEIIVSTMHAHITHELCLETIFLKGKARQIKDFSEDILSFKAVIGGKLYITPIIFKQ
ncbi:MAG: nickel-responsive transcriptional regulator NikR [Candidatus Heimdallarchaeaceae archaeon]